jgi:hypothetical protein
METLTITQLEIFAAIAMTGLVILMGTFILRKIAISAARANVQENESANDTINPTTTSRRLTALSVVGRESARSFGQLWVQPLRINSRTTSTASDFMRDTAEINHNTSRRPGLLPAQPRATRVSVLR